MNRVIRGIAKRMGVVALAAAAFTLISCEEDNPNFATPEDSFTNEEEVGIIDPNSNGYLTISGLSLFVEPEEEGFADRDEATTPAVASAATRVDDLTTLAEATDDYILVIYNEKTGETSYKATYDRVKELDTPLTLKAGYYAVMAKSCEEIPAAAWNSPSYFSDEQSFVVSDEKTYNVEELICRLASIKVGVTISADMLEEFKTEELSEDDVELQVYVTYNGVTEVFTVDEVGSLYFAPSDDCSELEITLVGMYNTAIATEEPSYTYIEWEHTITDVSEGQSREISIKVANYNDGKIEFKLEVQSWTYDAPLGENIYSGSYNIELGESEIYDPDSETTDVGAPVVTLDNGLSMSEYTVYAGMMDSESQTYTDTYTANITPQNGASIKQIDMRVYTDNDNLDDKIYDLGYNFEILPVWSSDTPAELVSPYMDFTTGDNGAVVATLKYAAIELLNSYKGNHRFVIKATDSSNLVSHTNLAIQSISVGGPEVVWRGDYDFGTVYTIYTEAEVAADPTKVNPEIVLDITSGLGITGMSVKITSSVLTPEELGSIGLSNEMDLINPGDSKDGLMNLGFPVEDQVEGVKSLTFDITEFMPTLASICAVGSNAKSDFTIMVTDGTGTREVTLQMLRE